jgi:hypothetical protein
MARIATKRTAKRASMIAGSPSPKPIFRTPEDVAPELGMRATELRRYVRESGICTRLSKNRIMLHEDDITKIIEWVRGRRNAAEDWSAEVEHDPFA